MDYTGINKFRTIKVASIAFSHLTHDIYTAFLAPLLPILIDKLDFSYSVAGLFIFLLRLPSIISPLVGKIADRRGTKYFIIFMPAITAIAMSFVSNANSISVLCLLLLIAGLSSAFFHVPAPVMIKHFSGQRLGRGMSLFMMGGELARTIGPLIILGAISIWGLEDSYRVVVLGILASIILSIVIKDIPVKKVSKKSDRDVSVVTILKNQKSVFIITVGLVTSKAFMIIALTSFLPIYMTTKGASIWLAGAALSIIELAGSLGTLLSGTISDFIGRRKMLLIVTLIAPIIMIVFVFTSGWLLFPILVILGLLVFAVSPVIMAFVIESEDEYPASANSIYMTINFVASSLIALLFGFLGDIVSLDFTYIISAVLSLVAIPFILKMPNKSKKNSLSSYKNYN